MSDRILSSVTISLVPEAAGGPFVYWDGVAAGCRAAAELGFDAVEIFPPSADLDRNQIQQSLDNHKLELAAVGTGAGWVIHRLSLSDPNTARRDEAISFVKGVIDLAGSFGAPAIIGSMQGRAAGELTRNEALSHLAGSLNVLGEYALRQDVPLLMEPINRYESNLCNSLSAAAAVIESLDNTNVRILADLFHMNIEEPCPVDSLRRHGRHVGHVHFADSNRWAAGFGHTDFAPVASVLRDIGYQGYVSAEVFPLPDSDAAARQTINSFKRFFRDQD